MTHLHDVAALIDPAERTRRAERAPGRRRAGVALAVILLPILVATVAGLWLSGAKPQSPLKFAAAGVSFPRGKVSAMSTGPCGTSKTGSQDLTPVPWAGRAPICGRAVTITVGSAAGHAVSLDPSRDP